VTTNFKSHDSRERCRQKRLRILDMSQKVPALHIAPAFSCIEMVDAVYFGAMDPRSEPSDVFIMSKGHGYLSQLVTLEGLGIVNTADVDAYCTRGGLLGAHPDVEIPGIAAATGSLGHGLGMGLGLAIALRNDATQDNARLPTVYVLLSDGELQEGSTWEAVLMAASLNVSNLVALVDNNDFQSLGRTSETHPNLYPITNKFETFGWEADEEDGHDTASLVRRLTGRTSERPYVLVGRTTKGKGVSFMENVPIWHYRSPSSDEYQTAVEEINRG